MELAIQAMKNNLQKLNKTYNRMQTHYKTLKDHNAQCKSLIESLQGQVAVLKQQAEIIGNINK